MQAEHVKTAYKTIYARRQGLPLPGTQKRLYGAIIKGEMTMNTENICCCSCNDKITDHYAAIIELQAILHRIAVFGEYTRDLIQTYSPGTDRALAMIDEIGMLAADGQQIIQNDGVEI